MKVWLSVISMGSVGVGARFALDTWISRGSSISPWITLGINTIGCFLAGAFAAVAGPDFVRERDPWIMGSIVGFCGGFTTYSGYALYLGQMYQQGDLTKGALYFALTPTLSFLAVMFGFYLVRRFLVVGY